MARGFKGYHLPEHLILFHLGEIWGEEHDFAELYLEVSLVLHLRLGRPHFCSGMTPGGSSFGCVVVTPFDKTGLWTN